VHHCTLKTADKPLPQVYAAGNAFTILSGAHSIYQTVYDDDETPLEAVAFDESTGKIATCTATQVRVYKPLGLQDNALKV
jgi:hypothetical protein